MNYLKTTEKKAVENYPYGYTQKTTAFFSLDFNPKKGFRTVFQTINPKTGALNKPKMSTYSPVRVLTEENGKISSYSLDFYGNEGMEKAIKFFAEHFELFTPEQQKYLALQTIMFTKVNVAAQATYCGSDVTKLLALYDAPVRTLVEIAKTGENKFGEIHIDFPAIEALKVEGFNPFKTVHYSSN